MGTGLPGAIAARLCFPGRPVLALTGDMGLWMTLGELGVVQERGLDLAQRIGLTPANLSKLKTGKIKAIRFSTLEALCRELECQPGDLLEYEEES